MSIKFRKAKSPAFNVGEVWYSSCGFKVTIERVEHFNEEINMFMKKLPKDVFPVNAVESQN